MSCRAWPSGSRSLSPGCRDVSGVQHDHLGTNVVRSGVGRHRTAVARRQIVEQLDAGATFGTQSRDTNVGVGHCRQTLLLDPPILAGAGDAQSESVAIKGEAPLGIACGNRAVVDAEKQMVLVLPARIALA